jgi:hypothetical protein
LIKSVLLATYWRKKASFVTLCLLTQSFFGDFTVFGPSQYTTFPQGLCLLLLVF